MNRIKKGWENPAFGIIPIIVFLILDEYFPYMQAYLLSALFCLIAIFVLRVLKKERIYSFILLPATMTFVLYALFLILIPLRDVFFIYTPVIVEILLVISLICIHPTKKLVFRYVRGMATPAYDRVFFLTSLNEFFFVASIFQNLYTLHIFMVLLYSIMPESIQDVRITRFFYRDLGLVIGLSVLAYEQIRLLMVQGRLKKEMWLPVLNDQGSVIGCIAYSVSRMLPKKYFHPIIRIAIVHKGMLYLVKRGEHCCVSASTLDYPVCKYVLFRQSIEQTVRNALAPLARDVESMNPRLLLRYVFENNKVKHQVSLFVVCLKNEKPLGLNIGQNGKFWTVQQIEENLNTGIFSEYMEKEFPYLKNTILLAENIACRKEQ